MGLPYLKTPEYRAWSSMRTRCNNKNYVQFHCYGGRGITVCERWERFEAFLADMGPRPSGHTLDRIDVNGHYAPENCRWATPRQQAANRRDTVPIVINGVSKIACEWADVSGISANIICCRIYRGWPAERAVFWPYGQRFVHVPTAISLYQQGLSLTAVGARLGVTRTAITKLLRHRGLLRSAVA